MSRPSSRPGFRRTCPSRSRTAPKTGPSRTTILISFTSAASWEASSTGRHCTSKPIDASSRAASWRPMRARRTSSPTTAASRPRALWVNGDRFLSAPARSWAVSLLLSRTASRPRPYKRLDLSICTTLCSRLLRAAGLRTQR